MPEWVVKLAKRLQALTPGRYQVIITVGKEADWTVQFLGKVER